MACILLWSSAVRVHDSQAYSKMDVTREGISRIWNWEKYTCHSRLVSTLSMLLLSVLSWRVSQAGSPGSWSLWQSQASVHLLWSLCWCHWCCLSSAWSSQHWSQCRRLWRLCWDAQLILPVLLPLLLSHWCRQQSGGWWLFCLKWWQCCYDLLRRLSWSFPEICWRVWVRVDIPVRLQLWLGTSLLCCCWKGLL